MVRMMIPEEALVRARTLGLGELELGSKAVGPKKTNTVVGSKDATKIMLLL